MKTYTRNTTQLVDHTAGSAVTAGDVIVDNGRVLIAVDDIAAGAVGPAMARNGEVSVTKAAGTAWSEGDEIFYDATNTNFTVGQVNGGTYAGLANRDATSGATTGYLDLGAVKGSGDGIKTIAQTVAFGDFTDNANTTGYVDLDVQLPAGAIPLGVKYVVATGFTGDTTAVVQTGVAGDLDRFSSVTDQSVLAAATVGHGVAADACDGINAAQTIRVTVTGAADFTSIAAGSMKVELRYIETGS